MANGNFRILKETSKFFRYLDNCCKFPGRPRSPQFDFNIFSRTLKLCRTTDPQSPQSPQFHLHRLKNCTNHTLPGTLQKKNPAIRPDPQPLESAALSRSQILTLVLTLYPTPRSHAESVNLPPRQSHPRRWKARSHPPPPSPAAARSPSRLPGPRTRSCSGH